MPLPAPSLCEPVSFPAPLPFFLVNNSSFSSYPDPQLLSFSLSPFSGTRGISLLVQGWGALISGYGSPTDQNSHAWEMEAASPSLLSLLGDDAALRQFLGEVDIHAPIPTGNNDRLWSSANLL